MWLRLTPTARWRGSCRRGEGSECCAVLADEVSEGQRGAAAGRGEEGGVGVHPRDRGVVRHRPGVGRQVLDHRVVDKASGRARCTRIVSTMNFARSTGVVAYPSKPVVPLGKRGVARNVRIELPIGSSLEVVEFLWSHEFCDRV